MQTWKPLLAAAAALLAVACGGSDGPSDDGGGGGGGDEQVGTAVIGPAGGTLVSADSAFRLDVPAGALPADTRITVTVVTPDDSLSLGREYRLEPANLEFTGPVTIQLGIDSLTLGDRTPSQLGIAFEDADGVAYGAFDTEVVQGPGPSALRGMALRSIVNWFVVFQHTWTNLPRWVRIQTFWKWEPNPVRVPAGSQKTIAVLACVEERDANLRNEWILRRNCQPSIRRGTWRMRPDVSAGANLGTITAGTPSSSALYTASATRPDPSLLLAEASLLWESRGLTYKLLIPITVTQAGTGSGLITWDIGGNGSWTFGSGTESLTEQYAGSAIFESAGGRIGGEFWMAKSANIKHNKTYIYTTVVRSPGCTTTTTETTTEALEGGWTSDPANPWIASIQVSRTGGVYLLAPGAATYQIRVKLVRRREEACAGSQPSVTTETPIDRVQSFAVSFPTLFSEPLSSPDARQYQGTKTSTEGRQTPSGNPYQRLLTWSYGFVDP